MNIGKSIKLSLLDRGWTQKDLSKHLGMSYNNTCVLARSKTCTGDRLRQLAEIFGMKASEFVALGEK